MAVTTRFAVPGWSHDEERDNFILVHLGYVDYKKEILATYDPFTQEEVTKAFDQVKNYKGQGIIEQIKDLQFQKTTMWQKINEHLGK